MELAHLIGNKNAFREIRYSVDSDRLDQSVRFTPDWKHIGTISDTDQSFIEIPLTAQYVLIKLVYTDGSETVRRVPLTESNTQRP